jgi:hypothetical protein
LCDGFAAALFAAEVSGHRRPGGFDQLAQLQGSGR